MVPLGTSARLSAQAVRRFIAAVVIVAAVALFISCSGEGPGSITAPQSSGTTPGAGGATNTGGGTNTPPATPPADTTAGTTPPAAGGTGTPTDSGSAPGATGTTPPGTTTPPDTTTPPAASSPGSVTAIAITPSTLGLTVGDSSKVVATLTTTGSPPVSGWTVAWQSTDPAVVSVGTDGTVKARAVGTAAITATAGGKTATVVVTVGPTPWVNSVAVSPPSAVMMIGDQLQLTAVLGTVGTPPAGGWPVSWQSNQPSVATVSPTGLVTAVAPGSSMIFANSGVAGGTSSVRVVAGPTVLSIALSPATLYLAPGATGSFTPVLSTIGTMPSGGWPITWSSASPAVATVDAAGVITGVSAGSTTITASSGTATAAATVAVATPSGGSASVVTAVAISGTIKPRILTGGTKTFAATVTANGPPPATGWVAAWTSSNPAVFTVVGDGAVGATITGIAPGSATLTATVGGVSATRNVDVLAPPGVFDVRINAQSPYDLALGDAVTLDAQVSLLSSPPGGVITTWTSSNPAVATVDASGTVRGVALGNAVITATSYGVSGSITFNILTPTPPPPPPTISGITSIALRPTVILIGKGYQANVFADVVATTSPPASTLSWPVNWSSSTPAAATVVSSGMQVTNIIGVANGMATITGELGGKTATTTVYVATATGVSVSPTTLSLAVGQQGTLTSSVTSTGPLPPGGYPASYGVSSPLVASVSPTGVVTALGAGKTRIFVNAWPAQTTAVVTVTGPGLSVSLTGTTTMKGTVGQFDATTNYLGCTFPMSMTATGSGTAIWGNEEWSYDGGPFKSYPPMTLQTLAAGSSLLWRVYTGSTPVVGQPTGYTVTVRTHYAVNEDSSDYPNPSGFAQDNVISTTYTCQP